MANQPSENSKTTAQPKAKDIGPAEPGAAQENMKATELKNKGGSSVNLHTRDEARKDRPNPREINGQPKTRH